MLCRLPNFVTTIHSQGSRIFVGDLQEGFFILKYKHVDNKMYACAEVVGARYTTAALHLDYDTMAGADKFGNFYIARLPADESAEVCCVCRQRVCVCHAATPAVNTAVNAGALVVSSARPCMWQQHSPLVP